MHFLTSLVCPIASASDWSFALRFHYLSRIFSHKASDSWSPSVSPCRWTLTSVNHLLPGCVGVFFCFVFLSFSSARDAFELVEDQQHNRYCRFEFPCDFLPQCWMYCCACIVSAGCMVWDRTAKLTPARNSCSLGPLNRSFFLTANLKQLRVWTTDCPYKSRSFLRL